MHFDLEAFRKDCYGLNMVNLKRWEMWMIVLADVKDSNCAAIG